MDISDLKRIGLTEGEFKVYSALLDLGETTRTELAKKSGISPSKIYDVANKLLEKGIISSVKKNGVIHFSAANPERLKDFLANKEEEIKKEQKLIDELMPSILSRYQKTKEDVDIEVLYGWEGMKTVYMGLANSLSKKDINYVVGASLGKNSEKSDLFFIQYFKQVKKRGYKQMIIFNEDVRGHKKRTEFYRKNPIHEIKYLYQNTYTEFNCYKDNVLIIMLLAKPIIIRIKNKEAAESFKKYFNSLWNIAKS
ncbi:MAG: helix-turn-helix domain-containing protein [Nanoarchaeota archaeon]